MLSSCIPRSHEVLRCSIFMFDGCAGSLIEVDSGGDLIGATVPARRSETRGGGGGAAPLYLVYSGVPSSSVTVTSFYPSSASEDSK